ncbi:hypothetical protein [Pseudomonas fontis]|uniref:Lipoprotein n=1 Tax=Pseudomonas fontis TaxID=2942633 RepID=A0ABT5NQ98_9PSED|nr:hypothetical protein [Pseudomonas fontis]MDD0977648.1 hypothetical protein [Pseudomonas fontis]MDD0990322.1 hypothetical protein [Pseudomonas fontis]
MRHLALASLVLLGCVAVPTAIEAQDYYGPDSYGGPAPSFSSVPPGTYRMSAPQPFELVSTRHGFQDAQLPRIADRQPSVIIRSYDPDYGVYTDAVVRDREPRPQPDHLAD